MPFYPFFGYTVGFVPKFRNRDPSTHNIYLWFYTRDARIMCIRLKPQTHPIIIVELNLHTGFEKLGQTQRQTYLLLFVFHSVVDLSELCFQ